MTSSESLTHSLIVDTPCRRCGYNLRGLTTESRCPECNSPVSVSIQTDLLRFCDPHWLERLARGCSLFLWGILVGIIAVFSSQIITTGLGFNSSIGLLLVFLGSLVSYCGAWLLTTPDVTQTSESKLSPRNFVRISIMASLSAAILEIILGALSVPELFQTLFDIFSGFTSLLSFIGQIAMIFYLGRLAERVPEPTQQKRARILVWAISICTLVLVLGFITVAIGEAIESANNPQGDPDLTPPAIADGLVMIGGCSMLPSGLILFVCLISSLFMIYRLGNCFREQAFFASKNWEMNDLSPPAARVVSDDEIPQP